MVDFLMIGTKSPKKGELEIYPKFIIKNNSQDLMIRGGDFYAVWADEQKKWSTSEQDLIDIVDRELNKFYEEHKSAYNDTRVKILHMWDSDTGIIDKWHKYCQRQMRDQFKSLDEKIIWENSEPNKKDYASKSLPYPLKKSDISSYERLMSVLYSPEERHKIEWAIGSIVTGDSKTIQKFLVLYGAAGTGKSTVLNIIQQLFEGYYTVFDAKALGSSNATFALEPFKNNPLIAIQHDGDLSRIDDNARLNSLVSHETMTINNKFEKLYSTKFKAFLFMGTNKPVKITDAKSGLLRRLIDVQPTGNKIPTKEYNQLVKNIEFELGGIAWHCKEVYESDPRYYDNYIPEGMISVTNDFYNFVMDHYVEFTNEELITLTQAWEMYKTWCDDAKISFPFSKRIFKDELMNYFEEFYERYGTSDNKRLRSVYKNFKKDMFHQEEIKEEKGGWLEFDCEKSLFDKRFKDCKAQYANDSDHPSIKWDNVKTTLKDLDTSRVHYVMCPENIITIDFDIPDEDGNKSFEKNVEAANKWPPTYAELSKSGCGIHLHYIYDGDASELSTVYADHIEIKRMVGNSSLRRRLNKCNDLPIASISSGLPRKEKKGMYNTESVKSEKKLRELIERNLRKEIHPGTKPSIDFIYKILQDAYDSGLNYDVTDMRPKILAFAANSSHQADYCIKLVNRMAFHSEEFSKTSAKMDQIIFYDVEVFPNLFLVNWKIEGEGKKVNRMINPSPTDIEKLLEYKLVGFNCRRYDNHIMYARLMGYNNEQLYNLSQKIIFGSKNCFFGEAYNLSYTDVYDFCSTKQSLKKWEIELGIHHQELGLPWDRPVPEEMWETVAEYCDNDVLATEAVFNARHADFIAREILAEVAGMTVNDTTNSLTTRIIFGTERRPQSQFNYRDMGYLEGEPDEYPREFDDFDHEYTVFKNHQPIFPGYIFDNGKSTYRGEEVGEGGYVYAEHGIYTNVALLDVASMHPNSAINEWLFGPYTERYKALLDARLAIKHKDFKLAKKMLNGALAKYLDDEEMADALSYALKIAINSVYGLTSASFENPFRDPRNIDNIVAKRGALFMINLKHEIQRKGFTVAHIKTDSIKIPNATPEIIDFVMQYGELYGYTFEHEATYDRMCLTTNADYICKYARVEDFANMYGPDYPVCKDNIKKGGKWDVTGANFAHPYIFKSLFSHEPIVFDDLCETKSVKEGEIYLDMNCGMPDVTEYEKKLKDLESKYKKGELSDTTFEKEVPALEAEIAKGHNYKFVGRVGRFTPVSESGGVLYRCKDGKYYAVSGTKGYRWLESEMVGKLDNAFDLVDMSYYISMLDEAKDTISQFGDVDQFTKGEFQAPPYDFMNIPETPDGVEELPWDPPKKGDKKNG